MKYLDFGLSEKVIRKISKEKHEPKWMLDYRLNAYEIFKRLELPEWGPDLSNINFNEVIYYAINPDKISSKWENIPAEIKQQFEDLNIPEHERTVLAGLSTQYESEVVYHNLKDRYNDTGIVFETIENGLHKYPKIFKEYFSSLVSPDENKFTALNSAVWSGGSFIYVPKGVKLDMPIETYFRINTDKMGQFERTLIIADEDSEVHYIEGCTAPQFIKSSLHTAVVEIFALKGSKIRYTTLQNWSKNVYNLVTKRSITEENASVEWLDINIGSKITMKYPTVILKGKNSKGIVNSIALSGKNQNIDSGAKMIHLAEKTQSQIKSITLSKNNGISTFRGKVKITKTANNSRSYVKCENALLSNNSVANSYPNLIVKNNSSLIEHEAVASNISKKQMDYLLSRGIDEEQAKEFIISGMFSYFNDQLPLEYVVELERIIQLFNKNEKKSNTK